MKKPLSVVPNFPELEAYWLDHWQTHSILDQYLHKNDNSKTHFSFFDGPITANNPMGVHHGWGRTYKDLWQKFHNLLGDKQRFQNGFDCQGLWVEVEVEKELKLKTKKDIENLIPNDKYASIAKFVNLCKERVMRFSKIQTQQSQRLGYFMDWDNSYYTMSSENNYMIWHFLKVCHENSWVYKGHESVPWCPRCETAISQHEMLTEDYKEVRHETIYLKLPIIDHSGEYLLIWTTTPWTIPANIAVAVDKELDYSLVETESKELIWVAKELVSKVFASENVIVKKTVKGEKLVGLKYHGPFDELEAVQEVKKANLDTFHTVVATDPLILPINMEEGTGLVHTAVSAGVEDFKLGQKLGLPMIPVIADNADYLPKLGQFSGQNAKKNPRIILDYLEEKGGWVYRIEKFLHRYPACWRCKAELVWKVADEWYISMDKPGLKGKTLREMMIGVAKKIRWIPHFGLERELDWLNNMHDWLISKKNRYWGLALPIFECVKCRHFEVIGGVDELKERAVSGWEKFEGHTPHKPHIDEVKIKCEKCGGISERISDVGNPWLDAGIIPYSTLIDPKTGKLSYLTDRKYWKEWFPANIISESFPGQFKNWFYSMIAMSTVLEDTPSFKTVLGYATCVGEDGRPMHKSWGNYIDFNEGAEKMGADVMRWMYCRQDPKKNLPFGYGIGNEVKRNFHIPLWNILKFYLTYSELDKVENKVTSKLENLSLSVLDQWLLSRLKQTELEVHKSMSNYHPQIAAIAIEELVMDASQWYLRLSRQRVWQNNANQEDKIAFYSTLAYFLKSLTIILSLFLPFFSEEIYSYLSGVNKASVHLESWPDISLKWLNEDLMADMKKVRALAESGHVERKKANIKVRQPLSKIVFTSTAENMPILEDKFVDYEALLAQELNLKKIYFEKGKENKAELDTKISTELEWEGKVRDYIRQIQRLRQTENCAINEKITVYMPVVPEKYSEMIKNKVLATKIITVLEDTIRIERDK